MEEDAERAQVLSEVNALKKAAMSYAHPEAKVEADATAFARNFFHTPIASLSDAKLLTAHAEQEHVEVPEEPVHEDEDHHDLFEFDDFDQFYGLREQLSNIKPKPLPHAASFADFAHNKIEIKGDDGEGHLSRSPSCVAFFDYF